MGKDSIFPSAGGSLSPQRTQRLGELGQGTSSEEWSSTWVSHVVAESCPQTMGATIPPQGREG